MISIAIIDDEPKDCYFLRRILTSFPVTVETYKSSIDFGEHANPNDFDFVWIDFTINHGAGADAILKALTKKSITKIVFTFDTDIEIKKAKDYEENPIVWGLLSKEDVPSIEDWLYNRFHEIKNLKIA